MALRFAVLVPFDSRNFDTLFPLFKPGGDPYWSRKNLNFNRMPLQFASSEAHYARDFSRITGLSYWPQEQHGELLDPCWKVASDHARFRVAAVRNDLGSLLR